MVDNTIKQPKTVVECKRFPKILFPNAVAKGNDSLHTFVPIPNQTEKIMVGDTLYVIKLTNISIDFNKENFDKIKWCYGFKNKDYDFDAYDQIPLELLKLLKEKWNDIYPERSMHSNGEYSRKAFQDQWDSIYKKWKGVKNDTTH